MRKRKNKISERRMMLNLTLMMNLWNCQPTLTGLAETEIGTNAAGGSVATDTVSVATSLDQNAY